MEIRGRIENGVVVLEGGSPLPEGTAVTVVCLDTPRAEPDSGKRRVELPLVPSARPGSLRLTAERAAELLQDADVSA